MIILVVMVLNFSLLIERLFLITTRNICHFINEFVLSRLRIILNVIYM